MEPFWIGILGVVVLFILIAAGVPLAVSLGSVGLVGTALLGGTDQALWAFANRTVMRIVVFLLATVPLFVFMGILAAEGGTAASIYENMRLWMGRLKGGLGVATVGACTLFGTVCGSSMVTAAVFARLGAPEMRRHGYDKRFAYAITSSSGMIGMLIPPSLLMIIFAQFTNESVGKLFITGITPGLLLFFVYSIGILIMVRRNPSLAPPISEKVTWGQKMRALPSLWIVAVSAAAIIGGIFAGVFSPTESGGIGAFVLLITVILTRRRQSWQVIKTSAVETVNTSGMLFLLLIGAGIFAQFIAFSGVSGRLTDLIVGANLPPLGFILATMVLYIILGCFLDSVSILAITIPAIYPTVLALGIHPMYFAALAIVNIEIGLITPPVGLNVFAVQAVAESDVSLEDLFIGVLPFFFMALAALALLIAFPDLSTWLPDHTRY